MPLYRFTGLTLVMLISAFRVYSQPYQSVFGKDSTSWFTHVKHYDGAFTERFRCYNEDSVVNEISHKIIYGEYNRNAPAFLLSEDTMTGELWMKHPFLGDKLLMTLSLDTGDSFVVYSYGGRPEIMYHVSRVYTDSLHRKVIQFKQKHNRYTFPEMVNYPDSNIMFIEGVGPSTGIAIMSLSDDINELLCAYKNEVRTYANLYYKGVCHIQYGSVTERFGSNALQVYPNPFTDKIYIEQSSLITAISQAKIYDIQGNLRLTVQLAGETGIDVSVLKPGIYFLYPEHRSTLHTKPIKLIKL